MKALLLDLDGTVADSHGLIRKCYHFAIQKHLGKPGTRALWEQCIGLPLDAVLRFAFDHYGEPLPTERLEVVKQDYRTHMEEHCDEISVFPGIPETLEALRGRGIRLAIVTTKHLGMATSHLKTLHLTHFFEAVITGDMCAHYKPHPDPFLKALAALNLPPDVAVGIGDSVHDIHSARGAGLHTAAALWGTDDRDALLSASPNSLLHQPGDLLGLL